MKQRKLLTFSDYIAYKAPYIITCVDAVGIGVVRTHEAARGIVERTRHAALTRKISRHFASQWTLAGSMKKRGISRDGGGAE